MRVLYDISTLGLAHLYKQSRGGAWRADLHLTEGLAGLADCELLFCANHSTVAYHGSEAFLADHPRLRHIPLLGGGSSTGRSSIRTAAAAAHRYARRLVGSHVLPTALRRIAGSIDTRLHPPVAGVAAGVDVLHSPSVPLPIPGGARSPARFLSVYDLSYFRFPEIYGAAYQRAMASALGSVRPDDRVITASRFIRDELCERGVASPDRIHVVPLAAHPSLFYRCDDPGTLASVRRRYAIPDGPFVLSVNSPDPRKNVPHAIHAFARAVHERGHDLSSLVLTGNEGPGSDGIHQAIAQYPELRDRVVHTGHVPDEDLAPLYSAASVFVYPSIYEGFGLPPLEAMQCGTPVITLKTSSLPEVVGDGGVLVPPGDVEALAQAMLDLAGDGEPRRRIQQRALVQARRFSWERSTTATMAAYRAALHQSAAMPIEDIQATGTGADRVWARAASRRS